MAPLLGQFKVRTDGQHTKRDVRGAGNDSGVPSVGSVANINDERSWILLHPSVSILNVDTRHGAYLVPRSAGRARCEYARVAQACHVMAEMAPRWPIYRLDGDSAAVAIERGGELAAFAYRRGERIGPAAGRDETALLRAVAAAAAASAGGVGSLTVRIPGACATLLEALVGCGFRIGDPTLLMASRPFGRPELYLPSGSIVYEVGGRATRARSNMTSDTR